jgi:PilX N-terminal
VRIKREEGVALITALMILLLVSAIIVGMSWMVMTDQRLGGNNQNRETAFYAAEAGMEQLTSDVGTTFTIQGSLTPADITVITSTPPTIPGIQFLNGSGASTYQITPLVPITSNATILAPSPYAGMSGLITPFTLTVSARTTATGSEVKLTRQVQVVSIPVFQFGIYSDSDLSFFNGPQFSFGGRTHTNGNLWLAPNSGPLFMGDKVTVAGQVIRTNLENGVATCGGSYCGDVSIATTPSPATLPAGPSYTNAQWRLLATTEGSVTGTSIYGGVSTTLNNPTWTGTVLPAYNGQLQNGVPVLNLTSTSLGGITKPINLIRRPIPGELATTPAQFNQRLFSLATLRILIDDYPVGSGGPGTANACHNADMMSLDTITPGDPTDLGTLAFGPLSPIPGGTAAPAWYTGVFPLPASGGATGANAIYSTNDGYWVHGGYPTVSGCIKIEYQTGLGGPGTWVDATHAILNLGFIGRNINPTPGIIPPQLPVLSTAAGQHPAQGPSPAGSVASIIPCTDPSPNAIIRLARVRDNPSTPTGNGCGTITAANPPSDFWPNVLFDTREGIDRASGTAAPITAQGVMNYVELDTTNLVNWLTANQTGLNLDNTTGYTFYFSDRRGEQVDPSTGSIKTGSYGFNDFVNPNNPASGCPNATLDSGEDIEADGILRLYGGAEVPPAVPTTYVMKQTALVSMWNGTNMLNSGTGGLFPNACGGLNPSNRPDVTYGNAQEARENPPVFFRRALKIVNGAQINIGTSCSGTDGLTTVAENPIYIQGDYNAPVDDGSWTGVSVAAAVEGDAVTFLSNNWNDINSFIFPYNTGSRAAVPTAYRMADISGKGIPFPSVAGQAQDFGTDGGVHNFLRFLENWGIACHYRGSMVSFYYNHQAVGTYKGTGVYSPPQPRDYTFDTNFTLGPQCLPPRTPSLRSVNTIGFSQEVLPSQ